MSRHQAVLLMLVAFSVVGCRHQSPAHSPAPISAITTDLMEEPRLTPHTSDPELRYEETQRLLRYLIQRYPPARQTIGYCVSAVLWVLIDERGRVRNTRVIRRSGDPEFDLLVQRALRSVKFVPARNGGETVSVWAQLPVSLGMC